VGVLDELVQPGRIRYRFSHAFFRQTLYEEMIAPRRLRLHQQVARAIEARYPTRLEEHAGELAEHFSQSTDPQDLAKAVEAAFKEALSLLAPAPPAAEPAAPVKARKPRAIQATKLEKPLTGKAAKRPDTASVSNSNNTRNNASNHGTTRAKPEVSQTRKAQPTTKAHRSPARRTAA
jgi:hypothetical protein